MIIFNWNIQAGGGTRVQQIADTIIEHSPDVVVLTEFREGKSGDILRDALTSNGIRNFSAGNREKNKNSVLIATKAESQPCDLNVPGELTPYVATTCVSGFNLVATFCATQDVGNTFLSFLSDVSNNNELKCLAVGDFFFGPQGSNINNGKRVDKALAEKWVNLYSPGADADEVWSFRNSRGGVSRPDHAWVTSNIRPMFSNARFELGPLDGGFSDHAPMVFSYREAAVL